MRNFIDFLVSSPSSHHAAHTVEQELNAAGFTSLHEDQPWPSGPGSYVIRREGAVIAIHVPESFGAASAVKIVGSHTDSPGFKLKPTEQFQAHGWAQAPVEVYGGPILASWFDRELAFAGRVIRTDGTEKLINTGPIARIPNLAIHLYRSNTLEPNPQQHMQPLVGLETSTALPELLENLAGGPILAHDLITVDTQLPQVFGTDGDLLAAGRLDNLSSVYPSLAAMVQVSAEYEGSDMLVMAAFDHEEVGSSSTTGAGGPFLEDVLQRAFAARGLGEDERYAVLARSSCVSADAAHSVHPNYAEKHDPQVRPLIGAGPVLKLNAKQRYATTARTAALWMRSCAAAGVDVQSFVSNNSVPCGSTIGPISATRLGIDTVDVGIPLLSMHSAREMCGLKDVAELQAALQAYLAGEADF